MNRVEDNKSPASDDEGVNEVTTDGDDVPHDGVCEVEHEARNGEDRRQDAEAEVDKSEKGVDGHSWAHDEGHLKE